MEVGPWAKITLLASPLPSLSLMLLPRLRRGHPGGARGEDRLPLADVQRGGQRDRAAAGGGEGHPRARVVGQEDRTGEYTRRDF